MQVAIQTILCIDDDEDDLSFIREAIHVAGDTFQVAQVHNGLEGLEFLEQAKVHRELPCLIILDMNMPLMDGKETLKKIKEDRALSSIPIVMLTTSSAIADKLFCAHYNVKMMTKPHSYKEMQSIIEKVLGHC
jgi:CheY-like chemotaxis protein